LFKHRDRFVLQDVAYVRTGTTFSYKMLLVYALGQVCLTRCWLFKKRDNFISPKGLINCRDCISSNGT